MARWPCFRRFRFEHQKIGFRAQHGNTFGGTNHEQGIAEAERESAYIRSIATPLAPQGHRSQVELFAKVQVLERFSFGLRMRRDDNLEQGYASSINFTVDGILSIFATDNLQPFVHQ